MLRRGCALAVTLFVAIFALYLLFFSRYFEAPGNLIAAGFGALLGAVGLGSLGHLAWAWRDTRAFARAARGDAPVDGELLVAAGPIRPLGMPLTSPFGGTPCVAYDYEVFKRPEIRRRGTAQQFDFAGFSMTASAIETRHGGIRLLGFPILDQFPQAQAQALAARERAERYVASTVFEPMHGFGAFKMFSEFDDALADADGIVRKDFRLEDSAITFDGRTLQERIVGVGEQVCAVGRFDATKSALVPRGTTLNRLWPGTPEEVRRKIVGAARGYAKTGLAFFAVGHAMLAVGFYLSETRHAREPEDRQASVIRSAVQDNDIAALERAVRRGANPNARGAFGTPALMDVRDPVLAAALLRLGADVDARDRSDGETPLIRASRMGNIELVRVLLAGGANVQVESIHGATALGEAVREGHDELVALLKEAAARRFDVERPRGPGGR